MACRYDLPLSLLMIDVDDFKKFNDEFGHQLGRCFTEHEIVPTCGEYARQSRPHIEARIGNEGNSTGGCAG